MALFVLIVAIAACPAAARRGGRPTFGDWKEGKANESAAEAAKVAKQKKMAAVDKVVELLEGLKTKVLSEGESEAATYNKYSCWCKDTSAEKLSAIQKGKDDQTALTTTIEALSTARDGLDGKIMQLMKDIEDAEIEMKKARKTRAAELKVYTTNSDDLKAALTALDGAIKSLKSSKGTSFAQFKGVSQTVRTALLLADALGLGGEETQKAAAFFQQAPDVPMEDYKFHSDGIIATLERLLDDFRKKKAEVDKDEVAAVKAFDQFIQDKTHLVKTKNAELDDSKDRKATTQQEIAAASQQLTTTSANLLADQEYLKELTQICHDKAKTWDQRSKVRSDELATLTQVIGIITTAVSSNTTAATLRFNQQGVSIRLAQAVASNEVAMEAVEADAEAAEAPDSGSPNFLQTREDKPQKDSFLTRRLVSGQARPGDDGRDVVAQLLRRKGSDLKSAVLTALANQISGSQDPFAKVKALIQELLERLLQEASSENTQKGWCDKSISEAEQRRDYAAEKIKELNGQMAEFEATRDKLAEELAVLAKEIGELNSARSDAEKMRAEEKAENANTVQEAEEGMAALDQAMTIIDRFYKTVAKETVALTQQSPTGDAPDAGFDNFEAYTGSQSEAGGILGMMEVMKSDFARTISETQAAEAQAEEDHLAFMTETGKALAQKTTASSERTAQKTSVEDKLQTAEDALDSQTLKLQTALKELLDLKPVCIDTGMTYEDRVSLREDEIAALHKALCILNNFAEYGPAGAADSC